MIEFLETGTDLNTGNNANANQNLNSYGTLYSRPYAFTDRSMVEQFINNHMSEGINNYVSCIIKNEVSTNNVVDTKVDYCYYYNVWKTYIKWWSCRIRKP